VAEHEWEDNGSRPELGCIHARCHRCGTTVLMTGPRRFPWDWRKAMMFGGPCPNPAREVAPAPAPEGTGEEAVSANNSL
jgi:hypothetical protein